MIKDNNQLISVVVSIYNVEPYLRQCIDSIINQTYLNLEIILVVSESKDNSVQIAESYLSADSRIQLLHRPKLGLSDARNSGYAISKGEYICFVDADDILSPKYIEELYKLCIETNSDIAQCDFCRFTNEKTVRKSELKKDRSNTYIYSNIEMMMNLYGSKEYPSVVAWTKLYRKDLFTDVQYPVGKLHEDTGATHKLFYKANHIAVTSEKLYYYRMREGSIMNETWSEDNLAGLTFYEERLMFFMEKKLDMLSAKAICQCYTGAEIYLYNANKYKESNQSVCDSLEHKVKYYNKLMKENPNITCSMRLFTKITMNVRKYFPNLSTKLIDFWKDLSW